LIRLSVREFDNRCQWTLIPEKSQQALVSKAIRNKYGLYHLSIAAQIHKLDSKE